MQKRKPLTQEHKDAISRAARLRHARKSGMRAQPVTIADLRRCLALFPHDFVVTDENVKLLLAAARGLRR